MGARAVEGVGEGYLDSEMSSFVAWVWYVMQILLVIIAAAAPPPAAAIVVVVVVVVV